MRKLSLVGLSSDRARLIKKLQRSQLVEIKTSEESEGTVPARLTAEKDAFSAKIARVSSALSFYKEADRLSSKLNGAEKVPLKQKIADFAAPIEYVPFDEFKKIAAEEARLIGVMESFETAAVKFNEIKAERTSLSQRLEELRIYKDIDCRFSDVSDGRYAVMRLGVVPKEKTEAARRSFDDFGGGFIEIISEGKQSVVFAAAEKAAEGEFLRILSELEFACCPFSDENRASELIEIAERRIAELRDEEAAVAAKVSEQRADVDKLKRLYDYYDLELKKLAAAEQSRATESCYFLEAWFPAEAEDKVKKVLEDSGSVAAYEFLDPKEGEKVPTLVKNSRIVAPYQAVTNMYSVPAYGEIDPNPFVAVFFFIFFGVMMSDAGYGLLLAIGATVLLALKKPKNGDMAIVYIIAMGGVSTFIWGVLFGGWFGIELSPDSFLNKLKWFSPLEGDGAMKMMGLSMALGVVQILVGMGIQAAALIRDGKWLWALTDIGGWYAIFAGIGCLAVGMVLEAAPSWLNYVAIALFALGFVGLTLKGGRNKKGVAKIFGGLPELYDITGFLSDVLSYARLFGLGLSTGVVALVINNICSVIAGFFPAGLQWIGWIISLPILVFAHLFNIAINTLGAYVHNCRLQYIEFFNKFYTGEGHQFTPLGAKSKYTKIQY